MTYRKILHQVEGPDVDRLKRAADARLVPWSRGENQPRAVVEAPICRGHYDSGAYLLAGPVRLVRRPTPILFGGQTPRRRCWRWCAGVRWLDRILTAILRDAAGAALTYDDLRARCQEAAERALADSALPIVEGHAWSLRDVERAVAEIRDWTERHGLAGESVTLEVDAGVIRVRSRLLSQTEWSRRGIEAERRRGVS